MHSRTTTTTLTHLCARVRALPVARHTTTPLHHTASHSGAATTGYLHPFLNCRALALCRFMLMHWTFTGYTITFLYLCRHTLRVSRARTLLFCLPAADRIAAHLPLRTASFSLPYTVLLLPPHLCHLCRLPPPLYLAPRACTAAHTRLLMLCRLAPACAPRTASRCLAPPLARWHTARCCALSQRAPLFTWINAPRALRRSPPRARCTPQIDATAASAIYAPAATLFFFVHAWHTARFAASRVQHTAPILTPNFCSSPRHHHVPHLLRYMRRCTHCATRRSFIVYSFEWWRRTAARSVPRSAHALHNSDAFIALQISSAHADVCVHTSHTHRVHASEHFCFPLRSV